MTLRALSFYKFQTCLEADLPAKRLALERSAEANDLKGLIILGTEGINATVSGLAMQLQSFMQDLAMLGFQWEKENLKWSQIQVHPFRFFQVKLRKEIVSLGAPELVPSGPNRHLSPEEFHEALQDPDTLVLDTRNWYETQMGKFEEALDSGISEFREFPERLKKSNLPKDKKILIYCTGGIRCEKASLEMERQGYTNVFQLDGGILKYLEKFPNGNFKGDCFVFDERLAVDKDLNPKAGYELCKLCGQVRFSDRDCAHGPIQASL